MNTPLLVVPDVVPSMTPDVGADAIDAVILVSVVLGLLLPHASVAFTENEGTTFDEAEFVPAGFELRTRSMVVPSVTVKAWVTAAAPAQKLFAATAEGVNVTVMPPDAQLIVKALKAMSPAAKVPDVVPPSTYATLLPPSPWPIMDATTVLEVAIVTAALSGSLSWTVVEGRTPRAAAPPPDSTTMVFVTPAQEKKQEQ